jgi:hypothetical protein
MARPIVHLEKDVGQETHMAIRGIEGMTAEQVKFEVQRGGRFVVYHYCISIVVLTFRRGTDVYFVRAGESRVKKGMPWTLLTLVAGWWGIPFGPIFSIMSLVTNFKGGKDVTGSIIVNTPAAQPQPAMHPGVPVG